MNNGAIAGLNANQFRGQAHTLHGTAGAVNTVTLVETIQFGQFLNCRKVAESWSNVCRSLSKKSANLV